MKVITCCAPGCIKPATCEAILYDVYPDGDVFFERDHTCSHLCDEHILENEMSLQGERKPRARTIYAFTNKHMAQGFTIYRPLT